MKILYIAPIRLPTERAHGYAIMKMCEEFARLGNKVELVVPDKWAPALKERDPFVFYGIEKNFTLKRIRSTDFLGEKDGRGRISFWLDMFSFMFFMRFFNGASLRAADVIYTRDFRLVPFLPEEKTALEVHDIPAQRKKFTEAARSAQWLIAISNGLAQKIQALTGKHDVLIAPDAVDLKKFEHVPAKEAARKELDLPANTSIALYSGHFYGWKGAGVFAEAAKLMPEVFCVLVGGVDSEFEALKEKNSNQKNILLLPFQPPSRVPLYLSAADVLVLPNRSDSEISARYTSPLKLFEYMAARKPIIASDLPSIREILDEATALCVKPDSERALADGIRRVLADPVYAGRLAENARNKVEAYTWSNRAKKILHSINSHDSIDSLYEK